MSFGRSAKWTALIAVLLFADQTVRAALPLGPLFDQVALTLEPGERTEAAGPFYYQEQRESQILFAVPPLFSLAENPELETKELDILYPLFTYDRFGQEYRYQLGQLLSFAGSENQDGKQSRRFTVFPLYFQQRGPEPADNYTALLPFYGTLRHRLFRDEISFVMLPLYVQSRKKDVVTDNYLYPFFHLRRGDGLSGWQFWPFIGKEHKDVTSITNGFGDVTTIPGYDKLSLLWPIYYDETRGIGSPNQEHALGVLPFYASSRSPDRDSTSVGWPFFNVINDRGKRYREWQAPWPFVQVARGEGKTMTRVWPLFGTAHNATLESDFALWPLYKYNHLQSEPLERERTRVLFWVYSDVAERNTQTDTKRQRTDLWPLFTARRDANGNERFQLFAPVEPILANSKSIERNWSPVWSIWRAEKNAQTGAQSKSFLWNLYRLQSTPDSKKVSLLFGLFQYDTNPEASRWRLFHFPVATDRKSGTPAR